MVRLSGKHGASEWNRWCPPMEGEGARQWKQWCAPVEAMVRASGSNGARQWKQWCAVVEFFGALQWKQMGFFPANWAGFSGVCRVAHVVYVMLNVIECLTGRIGFGPGS